MFVELVFKGIGGDEGGYRETILRVERANVVAYGTETRLELTLEKGAVSSYDLSTLAQFHVRDVVTKS